MYKINRHNVFLRINYSKHSVVTAAVSKLRNSSVQCESPQRPGQGGGAARYRCRSLNNLLKIRINGRSLHSSTAHCTPLQLNQLRVLGVGQSWVPGPGHFWFLSPGIGTAAAAAYLITIITLASRTPRSPAGHDLLCVACPQFSEN